MEKGKIGEEIKIEPKVNTIWEIKEIADDFMNPLEIFREAISNAYDAGAKEIDIQVYINKNNELNLDDPNWKIYTEDIPTLPHYVGPTGKVEHCYINQGAIIRGHAVDSVLFNNVDIGEGAFVSQAVLMPNVKVGKGAKIYRAIVADGVKIDDGAVVGSPDSEEIVLISKRVKKGE